MPARSGDQYLQGLRDRPGEVWLGGEQVADVTSHPGLGSGARSVAALYDMQLDPEHLEEMTYPLKRSEKGSGERVGMSFVTPRTQQDLEGRRRMMERWARSSGGMLGRTPDYLNVILMACAAAAEFFGGNRSDFARNAFDYYEYVRDHDLTLTHTLVNLRRTRSSRGTTSTDEEVALHVTDERAEGIVVTGARVLATLGPLSDEILVFPSISLRVRIATRWTWPETFTLGCTPAWSRYCNSSAPAA